MFTDDGASSGSTREMMFPPPFRCRVIVAVGVIVATGAAAASEPERRSADWVAAAAALSGEGFARLSGPWEPTLPKDHAPHSETGSEVWQLSAHLRDSAGAPAGLQMSLLRLGLLPPGEAGAGSDWLARGIWRGHVVLQADATAGEERFARGMDGLVGHDSTTGALRLDDWSLAFDSDGWRLIARAGEMRADLRLEPMRPAGAIGADDLPFRGYAIARLAVAGTIATDSGQRSVQGSAWFEHLWGELPLPGTGPVASDRLILQLEDGSDISLVRTRRIDGRGLPAVEGVLIGPDGTGSALESAAVSFEPVREWQGRGAAWPVAWTLRAGDLNLSVTPVAAEGERSFAAPVWIGLVRAEGMREGRPVAGLGTLQLTGYGAP